MSYKIHKFKTRKEVVEFLDKYDFKYYVPRLEEYMDAVRTENKYYEVQVSENNKIIFCSVQKNAEARNGYGCDFQTFYDCDIAYRFYTKEAGEENYKEWLGMRQSDMY